MGGIPELLTSEDMVPSDNIAILANKIREVANNPQRMSQMPARNLEKARDSQEEMLRDRRNNFYRYLREQTQAWRLGQV